MALTQMSTKKGIGHFGEKVNEALKKEWKQLNDLNAFKGRLFKDLNDKTKESLH